MEEGLGTLPDDVQVPVVQTLLVELGLLLSHSDHPPIDPVDRLDEEPGHLEVVGNDQLVLGHQKAPQVEARGCLDHGQCYYQVAMAFLLLVLREV